METNVWNNIKDFPVFGGMPHNFLDIHDNHKNNTQHTSKHKTRRQGNKTRKTENFSALESTKEEETQEGCNCTIM